MKENRLAKTKRSIFKAGIGFTIGNYLLKGVTFITTPVFARLMSTSDFGKYNVFNSYESILFVVIGLAIHSSYKNAFYKFKDPKDPEGELGYRKYVSATMWFLIASFLAWLVIAGVFRVPISSALGIDPSLVYLLVAGSFVTSIINCYSTDKGIHYQYQGLLITSSVYTILNVLLSLLLMNTVFADQKYLGRILGGLIPGIVIYCSICIRYILRASARGMMDGLKWGIRYSLPIVPHGISQIILAQFDRIMIKKIEGDSLAGIYSFAYTIYAMLTVTSTSLDGIWSPLFYEKRKSNDYEAIKKGSCIYIAVVFLASITVITLCPELIRIMGGEKYRDAVYCAIPIVAGGFYACIYNVPCLVEYYHEKTKLIALSTACAALMNIVLNAVFIRRFGYVAAAYTTWVTYALYFLLHYIVAWRIEGRNLFSTKVILACILTMTAASAISLSTIQYPAARIAMLLIIAVVTVYIEEKRYAYLRERLERIRKNSGQKQ